MQRQTSSDNNACVHLHMSNIDVQLCLTVLSGRLNRNSRSKRPGLLSAGSIESSLFVAPMTTISPRLSKPSIKASRVDTIELDKGKEIIRHLAILSVFCWILNYIQNNTKQKICLIILQDSNKIKANCNLLCTQCSCDTVPDSLTYTLLTRGLYYEASSTYPGYLSDIRVNLT